MQLKTLLNRVHPIKGFVYDAVRFLGQEIEVMVRPRQGTKAICSGCERPGPTYDTGSPRRFAFVPLWGIAVYLVYSMRRVDCPTCGVKVERVPWAIGKRRITVAMAVFLSCWARRLSWLEVARVFRTPWATVFRSVAWVVEYGLAHRDLSGITALGVDEVQYRKGHKYLTVVYQIDAGYRRLLWIGQDRTTESLRGFFEFMGKKRTVKIKFICSDMWKPYLKVIRACAGHAVHILDRYHLVAQVNRALDKIRAAEARRLKREDYEPVLTHSRWCFLKNPENLTDKQRVKLNDVMQYDLASVRGYLLKESFQLLWEYASPSWAGWFLDRWVNRVMRSRLEPLKKVARSFRKHRTLILNWFEAKKEFSSGIVEGMNYKIKLSLKKAYGFRTYKVAEIALYHALGRLPEPKLTHEFW
jgi:transposase